MPMFVSNCPQKRGNGQIRKKRDRQSDNLTKKYKHIARWTKRKNLRKSVIQHLQILELNT